MRRLAEAWHLRTPRERRVLAVVALAVAALAYAGVAIPLERSRQRLERELPPLRASIASLQRDADEAKRLKSMPARNALPTKSPLASLASNAGGLAGAQIAVTDATHVRVTGEIAFGALLEWLGNAQATHGVRVESARLEALPAPGRVRADLTLVRT
jgi:general secretion pathway protein M